MTAPTRIVAVHGLPTSPVLWSRLGLPVVAPALGGLATPEARDDWSLASFVREVAPLVDADTVLVGHDLGGVVAAMVCLQVRPRALVLSGTALGPYWAAVRLTARAPLHRWFYERYAGRRFLTGAVAPEHAEAVLAAFPPVPELPARMRAVARAMRPPPGLAAGLGVPVHLIWGRDDRWYPPVVAHAVARGAGATLDFVPGGHLCMWEAPDAYTRALAARVTGSALEAE